MIIGIDLGTTNSLVAVWEAGKVTVIPNALGKLLTPSVVNVVDETILIGEPALNRLVTHPNSTAANFKRYMGTDKIYQLASLSFRPEELSALILKRLKEDAENYLGQSVTEAVITVPAYFSEAQRRATRLAGKLAGLTVERIINEPTAAGIAYGLHEQADETSYFIFDLGGGTFDVSVLSLFSGIIEVCASSGDNFLGGLDFTGIIVKMFIDHLQKNHNVPDPVPALLRDKILEQAELAKHRLSLNDAAELKIEWKGETLQFTFTNKDFELAAEPLLERLAAPIRKVLNDSKLVPSDIKEIILVGGATRMSVIKRIVARMFGQLPYSSIDPDTVVVQGAAIQAALKSRDTRLEEVVVTDVCPYSLGVGVRSSIQRDGVYFDPIIERNTVIPVSRIRNYSVAEKDQEKLQVKIYQGENFAVEKNVLIGEIHVDLPKNYKNPGVDIRFTYDINGLLEVECTILETGLKKNLIVAGNPGMNEEQIQKSLAAMQTLKIHPRESTENLAVLTRAERLFEELQGGSRAYLGQCIQRFLHVLDQQDATVIASMRENLQELISEFQSELELF